MIIQAKSAVIEGELRDDIWLEVKSGLISSINYGEVANADRVISGVLIPGFVDMHCHGGGGSYFSDSDPKSIERAIDTHHSHGTSTLVASLVTAPLEVLKVEIQRLVSIAKTGKIAGIHLEGPYLAPARCGAHDPSLLRDPKVNEIGELLSAGQGYIKMVTIAPELDGAIESIKFLVANGVYVAIGHSAANFEAALLAVEAGASIVTHFPNAVSKLDDEGPTLAKLAMKDSRLCLEMILDGNHVGDDIVKRILQASSERVALVTDAMCAAGESDGHYFIGQLPVTVRDSVARLDSNGVLAGSTLTMDHAFFNLHSRLGYPIEQCVASTSTIAARALGFLDRGEIVVGKRADLLEVDLNRKQIFAVS